MANPSNLLRAIEREAAGNWQASSGPARRTGGTWGEIMTQRQARKIIRAAVRWSAGWPRRHRRGTVRRAWQIVDLRRLRFPWRDVAACLDYLRHGKYS